MIFAVGSGFTLELQTEGVEPLIANEEVWVDGRLINQRRGPIWWPEFGARNCRNVSVGHSRSSQTGQARIVWI